MRHAQESAYELTTTLKIQHADAKAREAFVAALDNAVYEATGEHPAVTAYFVAPVEEGHEVEVGLRFEVVSPDSLDEWADEILQEALAIAGRDRGASSTRAKVVQSQLVMA